MTEDAGRCKRTCARETQVTHWHLVTLNNINFTRLQFDRTSWSLTYIYLRIVVFLSILSHVHTHTHTHIRTHAPTHTLHSLIHTLMNNRTHDHSRQFVSVSCATLDLSAEIHEWELERTRRWSLIIVLAARARFSFHSFAPSIALLPPSRMRELRASA